MGVVNWALVASLVANMLMLWQLWQQKHEFNHSRKELLIGMVKASMKALYSYGLELRAFGQKNLVSQESEQGSRLRKSIAETEATYKELDEILHRLISGTRIPDKEFNQMWSTVHVASGQIDEIGRVFEIAEKLHAPRASG
ncbi:MAG: hypothetical protein IE917_15785 [Betaproteobacteria bacterium]|nr:hypothetical protein [Betaproteobacteria bacterium]